MDKEIKYSPVDISFSIEYKNAPHTRPMPPHTHNAAELFLNLSYLPHVLLDSKVLPAEKDTLIIFPSYCVHKLSSLPDAPYERYVIMADTLWLEKTLGGMDRHSYLRDSQEPMIIPLKPSERDSIIEACKRYIEYNGSSDFTQLAYFFDAMSIADRLAVSSSLKKRTIPQKKISSTNKTVNDIIEYINEHLTENLMVKDIAGHFYLNPDYITRIFKKYTNTTINSYITMQRIAAAHHMLINGSSISEAQLNTGYSSYSHFFRIFKKETGMTPREFADMYSKTE